MTREEYLKKYEYMDTYDLDVGDLINMIFNQHEQNNTLTDIKTYKEFGKLGIDLTKVISVSFHDNSIGQHGNNALKYRVDFIYGKNDLRTIGFKNKTDAIKLMNNYLDVIK